MRWRRAILDALDVRPEEGRLVAVLLAHSFLIGVPRILTSTVAMALVLGSYQATALPWVYVGAAATIPLALGTALDEGRLKEGHLVLLAAVGAGFTVGTCLVRWSGVPWS